MSHRALPPLNPDEPSARQGRTVTITLTPAMIEALDTLTTRGLFGRSRSEVARRLLSERLQCLAREGWIPQCPPKKNPRSRR